MPVKQHVPGAPEVVESEESEVQLPDLGAGNTEAEAKAIEARRERAQQSNAIQSYEQLLGGTLGPMLYKEVSDLVSLNSLGGYAREGLSASLSSINDRATESAPESRQDINQAINTLEILLGPMAQQWVEANGGDVQRRLQGFVDANPMAIASLALLAAAGAIAADMSIPELQIAFNMTDELTVATSAKLGSLRNIAVEEISARVGYRGDDLRARFQASYEPEDEVASADAGFDYEVNDNLDLSGRGQWTKALGGDNADYEDHFGRVGVRYRPKKNLSIEGYGEVDADRGVGAGVNFKWKF